MTAPTRQAAALLACCGVGFLLAGGAYAASAGRLEQQISSGQNRVSGLAGALGAASSRLAQLNGSIASLQRQIGHVQGNLNQKRGELLRLRGELNSVRARLTRLEALQARSESVLSHQVVSSYEADRPDIVSVVLEARGFQDLLERLAFAQRIRSQDARVVAGVRAARRAVAAQATHLGAIEARQQALAEQVLAQRNRLDFTRMSLVQRQIAVAQVRRAKASELAGARARLARLQRQLSDVKAQQEATASSGGAAAGSGGAGPSVGGFTFPLPKGAASPPGTWTQDQGVDIAAPGGTPEFAVCSGTVVLHGIGGFGPWAPVLHCDSSIGGNDYVYYGHAGPGNQLPVGTRVSSGQTMSEVGPGVVGISSGPHLEIGFADSSGSPVGGSSGAMLSLLQRAY